MEPEVLVALVQDNIDHHRDSGLWAKSCKREAQLKEQLQFSSDHWDRIAGMVQQAKKKGKSGG